MNTTVVGALGAGRARVDGRGRVRPTDQSWQLDWWIGAEDRWHRAVDEVTVRQSHIEGAPVVETAMRVPGGDAVQRVYGADSAGTVVVEIENGSAVPFVAAIALAPAAEPEGRLRSLALDGNRLRVDGATTLQLPRPPGRWAVGDAAGLAFEHVRDGRAQEGRLPDATEPGGRLEAALLFPLAHRATLRVALAPADEIDLASLPSANEVARAWAAQLNRGLRVDLPDPVLSRAMQGARAAVLVGGRDVAALEDWGFDSEAAAAWSRLSWRRRRQARRRPKRPAPWDRVRGWVETAPTGVLRPEDAGPFLLDLRSLLAHEAGDGVDLLTDLPPAWLGRDLEVHQAPTRAAGAVSYAVRWHGERPALLWDCEQATTLRVPGVDPSWSTGERAGEALLAPVSPYSSVRGDSS